METLRVGAAVPDPPFTGTADGGLDIDLMTALAEHIGATVVFVDPHSEYDCLSGATVTPECERTAAFLPPYAITGQALAVNTRRLPRARSVDDLEGLTIGAQRGGTGQSTAERLVADSKAGAVRIYERGTVRSALTDLSSGACDAVLELAPVLTQLAHPIAGVDVVQRGITTEHIAIAVPLNDQALFGRLTVAQAELEADGTLQRIRRKWLGNPYTDQSLAVH